MARALLLPLLLCSASAAAGPRFLEDDYDAARAEARARRLPLVVEVWAPW